MPTKRHLLFAAAAVATLPLVTACAAPSAPAAAPADDAAFMAWLRNVTDRLKTDPYAKPLPMRSKFENEAFVTRLHDAYRKRTSRDAFSTWFSAQYPGFLYEGSVLAEQLPR